MKTRTTELLKKLEAAHKKGGESLFDRLGMAVEVYQDKGWIDEKYAGSKEEALLDLRTTYFSDLGCLIPMLDLIKVRMKFTDKAVWREYKWNLRAMIELLREEQKAERDADKPKEDRAVKSWKEEAIKLQEENDELKRDVAQLKTRIAELEGESLKLKDRLIAETSEKDRLYGRLLERGGEREGRKQMAVA